MTTGPARANPSPWSAFASAATRVSIEGADLVLPRVCGGCGCAGVDWCADCAARVADAPVELHPRVALPVPVWSVGRYRGPLRASIIAMKEHGRRDLATPLGAALAEAVITLARWGEMPDATRLHLVPAPTRRLAARRRGGDPVTAVAAAAAARIGPRARVQPLLVTSMTTRDSAGLGARDRRANLRGSIRMRTGRRLPRGAVILVDDVLTTGATAAESVRTCRAHGVEIGAVVVLAGA